tara:strand:+ start:108 stop:476 length:369 start_codon:yes stop_codon:yes gene_type:complete
MYKISTNIYLDKINNCYRKILTISPPPDKINDPVLHRITKLIRNEKLSPYKDKSPCCNNDSCIYAFINTTSCNCDLLCEENIEDLYSILIENKYEIDTKLTKITKLSNIKSKNLVCFIKKLI